MIDNVKLGGLRGYGGLVGFSIVILSSIMLFAFASSAYASNTVNSAIYQDSNSDGSVDRIRLILDENVTACKYEAADWTVNVASELNLAITGISCTGNDRYLDISVETDTGETGSKIKPVISYENQGANSVILTSGLMSDQNYLVIDDAAAPVIISASPEDNEKLDSDSDIIVYTFSEPMVKNNWRQGREFTSNPSGSSWFSSWNQSGDSLTLVHAPFSCEIEYEVSFDSSRIEAVDGLDGYTKLNTSRSVPVGITHTFTTKECVSTFYEHQKGSIYISGEKEYNLNILTPNGGEHLVAGDEYEITWESSYAGDYYVDVYYLDEFGDYQEIASQIRNSGSYTWLVPDKDVRGSIIKVDWNDLADSLVVDTSDDVFDIGDSEVEESNTAVIPTLSEAEREESPESDDTCKSCETIVYQEEITDVDAGDYIKSSSFSTVYYVTGDGKRRPFVNEQAFFTYADSFDQIKDVTDATLATLEIGDLMLVNPGVVLVKIESDEKVYAVDEENNLRWLSSESITEQIYGSDWSEYVVDVDVICVPKFGNGTFISAADTDIEVDLKIMKKREQLSA